MADGSVLNLSCPICKLIFKNSDAIYSTSCGHIFHFACLNGWKLQSTSCPQCRDYNPSSHRIYLNFDETSGNASTAIALKAQLEEVNKKVATLEKDVDERRINFQKLRCESDKLRKAHDIRIEKLSDMVNKLQAENLTLKDSIKEHNANLEKEKEIGKQLLKENADLKHDLESVDVGASDSILGDKLKMMQQKLKHLSTEFEKEVSNSTQLAIDKMKLQSYVDHMKETATSNQFPDISKANKAQKKSKQKTIKSPANTLVFRNFPLEKIENPLENTIISLALDLELILGKEDVKQVIRKNNTYSKMTPKPITLLVEFTTEEWKQKLLSCKEQLNKLSPWQSLEVIEYSDESVQSLFTYANSRLRGRVFGYIAIKTDTVVAKKSYHDFEEVIIRDRNDVNDWLKKSQYLVSRVQFPFLLTRK